MNDKYDILLDPTRKYDTLLKMLISSDININDIQICLDIELSLNNGVIQTISSEVLTEIDTLNQYAALQVKDSNFTRHMNEFSRRTQFNEYRTLLTKETLYLFSLSVQK